MRDARCRSKRKVISKTSASLAVLIALFLLVTVAFAQGSYDLSWHVIAGGGGPMQSAGYTLMSTNGQPLAGMMQSSSYNLCSGFWCENLDYGVILEPATAAKSGAPGETVTYMLRITNTGSMTDTFGLTYTGIGAYLPVTQTMLAAGAGSDVIANVTIPSSAANGTIYTTVVTATSQGDPIQSDASTLTTMAVSSCTPVGAADLNFTPAAPLTGDVITFSAAFTPTNATLPITYTWDFDDGAIGVGQIATHTFPAAFTAKSYTVTLTVDNICVDSAVIVQRPVLVRPHTLYLPLVVRNYPTLVFADDFTNGTLTDWTASGGTWTSSGGYMQGTYASGTVWNTKAISGTNFVYEGKVNLLSGYAVGLTFRSSADGASSYAVILDTVQGFKISEYSPHHILVSYPMTVQYNHWYTIKVVANGDTLEAYLDGVKRLSTTDTRYGSGQLGVMLHRGVTLYDDLQAWALP